MVGSKAGVDDRERCERLLRSDSIRMEQTVIRPLTTSPTIFTRCIQRPVSANSMGSCFG